MRSLLLKIAAKITRTNRVSMPAHFKSNLWVNHIFRLIENVFGRAVNEDGRLKIRLESVQDADGNVYCFTLEAYLANLEAFARAYIGAANHMRKQLRVVRIPQTQLAGMRQNIGKQPYAFAIAFESVGTPDAPNNSTGTYNSTFVTSGSIPALLTQTSWNPGSGTSPVGTVYNGVSGSLIKDSQPGTGTASYYALWVPNAASGSNAFTLTWNGGRNLNSDIGVVNSCYSGVGSSIDGTDVFRGTTSTMILSITTTIPNDWMVLFVFPPNAVAPGPGTTQRLTNLMFDSNGPLSTGANTLTVTHVSSFIVGIAFALPPGSPPVNSKFFMAMR